MIIMRNHIYITRGSEYSFRLMYRDAENRLTNFNSVDTITIDIFDRMNNKLLSKEATNLFVDNDYSKIITFNQADYSRLAPGEYMYSVYYNSGESKITLINSANLTLSSSNVEYSSEDNNSSIYLYNTPLICEFNFTNIIPITDEDTLIVF